VLRAERVLLERGLIMRGVMFQFGSAGGWMGLLGAMGPMGLPVMRAMASKPNPPGDFPKSRSRGFAMDDSGSSNSSSFSLNREITRKYAKSKRHEENPILTNFAPFRVISRFDVFLRGPLNGYGSKQNVLPMP
jgi:hypothetical protein